jgi:hypothetical protein
MDTTMKILHLGIIVFSLVFTLILSHSALAQTAHDILQERDALGQLSDPVHMDNNNKQYVNPAEMSATLKHNGAILIVNQTINKLEYKVGEKITVSCALENVGNNSITINHLVPLMQSAVTYDNGTAYLPINYPNVLIGGDETIEPSKAITVPSCRPSVGEYPTDPSVIQMDTPGTYNITSFAYFTIHDQTSPTSFGSLWSKPLQITVLAENQTLNQNLTRQVNLWTYDPPTSPGPVAISSNGSFVVIGTRQDDSHGSIFFLDKNGFVLWSHDFSGMVSSVNMSSDGQFVEARTKQIRNNGGTDFGYNEWETNPDLYIFDSKGQLIFYNPGLSPTSRSISLSQDQSVIVSKNGSMIFYGSTEKTLWIYDTKTNLVSVSVSPAGMFTAACTDDGLYYLDKNGALLWSHKIEKDTCPYVGSSDLGYLLAGPALSSHTGKLYIYDKEGNLLWQHTDIPEYQSSHGLAESSDGKYKVVITGQSQRNYGLSVSYYQVESIPEFPLAVPVLLIGLVSTIIFYRTRFQK